MAKNRRTKSNELRLFTRKAMLACVALLFCGSLRAQEKKTVFDERASRALTLTHRQADDRHAVHHHPPGRISGTHNEHLDVESRTGQGFSLAPYLRAVPVALAENAHSASRWWFHYLAVADARGAAARTSR